MGFEKTILNETEMIAFGMMLGPLLSSGAIIYLNGSLGVGKTTFVRGLLRGLGFQGKVKSPTYSIIQPYTISSNTIFHCDFYRLQTPKSLDEMGIQDYFTPGVIALIEWPEIGKGIVPDADLVCDFFLTQNEERTMHISAYTEHGEEILSHLGKKICATKRA
ncbi:MAG: tRNA (adenosine(37)-N6)-threonylcarbamoyltransferase complex ATPase subunit type 1 TsaE [Gammaproteobacteria bacterium RIFCSPHIGHO2_12_FULL_38_14]|nr:MAG: tRNA (adenosine(37)-N6)-threonylcarbamoyltransferase complex ATPase subunit type 1 TsaE [Gammaproteobacteria bacterium RIFCSPHIGHO2_12_FULL_38_14]